MFLLLGALGIGALFLFGGNTALAGVHVGGLSVGGMTAEEAASALLNWEIALTDGEQTWRMRADQLGILIDAEATARAAVNYGRREGGLSAALRGAFRTVDLPPVIAVDGGALFNTLTLLESEVNRPPQNAGAAFVNGQIVPRPAVWGQALDVAGSASSLLADPAGALEAGSFTLIVDAIPPAVVDPAPVVAAAQALLTNPLTLQAYDPVLDQTDERVIPPETWIGWLTAENSADGLRLRLDQSALAAYLAGQNFGAGKFGAPRAIRADEAAAALDSALASGAARAFTRLYYQPMQHIVQPGDTITRIAWNYGLPYPWIEQANPGVSALSVGQAITIPPLDTQITLPIIPGKRIVVSLSQQRVRVYENGALLWDWLASTGIDSSPTWTGVYQILSHVPNAYAGNWNLWMPNFMGVYYPVPGVDFTNGFHGFPTRSGGRLLWTNDLGRRVTYGCILLSDTNIALLYNWAEDGVVVEIQA
jgi:lipoprotein-anchoring transpeptidase ErfK/SrfK